MEVVEGEEQRETSNKVMCLLTDPEGTPLGVPMYLPQIAGPQQLQQMVNQLLNNVSFSFCFLASGFCLLVAVACWVV